MRCEYNHLSARRIPHPNGGLIAISTAHTASHLTTEGITDVRDYQIASLTMLLTYGWARLAFDVPMLHIVAMLSTVLSVQYVGLRWQRRPYDPKSALISGLSLCLLMRTEVLSLAVLAATLTIASKFLLQWRGRHIFNPTNFGLVCMLVLAGDHVWLSPGQWGNSTFIGFLCLCLGGWVIYRAARSDVTCAFLVGYTALVVGRAVYLGDPLTIPLHHLSNGALLLFAFFMISDPKTTPVSRAGRVCFAGLVATIAAVITFGLYRQNGVFWALALSSMFVPILNRYFPAAVPVCGARERGNDVQSTVHPVHGHALRHPEFWLLRFLRRQGRYQTLQ